MAREIGTSIESSDQFEDTVQGWAKRWDSEVTASLKMLEEFHKKSEKTVKRYLDDREDSNGDSRINLFWANTKTLQSALYASLPNVDVRRKYDDFDDDVARVATNLIERCLNYDVMENGKEYDTLLKQCLSDRLIPGLGVARVFYESETEENEVESIKDEETGETLAEGYTEESLIKEAVPCSHYFWGDVCWSWARTWADLRWIAFKNPMTKEQIEERFGEEYLKKLKFKVKGVSVNEAAGGNSSKKELWQKADIWEIWNKDTREVFWWSAGCDEILDRKDDPLELRGFFPCPRWMMANTTTSFLMPKSDFEMVQDILNEVDILHTRISVLTSAVKVVGVYDRSSTGIQKMLSEAVENELIPVDNWAMFAEKGGIQGQIDWLPLDAIVGAIVELRGLRQDNIMLLEKITGMADIIQGTGTHPREGVGTQEMKAEFGSVRIQALEEELAAFVTDICELKAEIISKHFSVETIINLSNATRMNQEDLKLLPEALKLIKDWQQLAIRVKVRSESMAMVDYSKLRHERTEFINNMSLFMQSAAPLVEQEPSATPYILQLLKWGMAGFKGSDAIEGVLDAAIEAAKNAPPKDDPKDDGKAEAEKIKIQGLIELEKIRMQGEMQKIQAKLQSDMAMVKAKYEADMQAIQAKGQTDQGKEEAQSYFAALQKEADTAIDMALAEFQSALKVKEIETSAKVRPSPKPSR